MTSYIKSIAHYLPQHIRTNAVLASLLGVSEEWIVRRTGIKEQRVALEESTSDLILPAAKECLVLADVPVDSLEIVIVGTFTPDYPTPSTASIVGHQLGAHRAWCFDLSAACSSFIYGLVVADGLIKSGAAKRILVCAADRLSSVTNIRDRKTATLFGDGAGVALVEQCPSPELGMRDSLLKSDGAGMAEVFIPAGGSRLPASCQSLEENQHFLQLSGHRVAEAAIDGLTQLCCDLMSRNQLSVDKLDWFVPHQANLRILEAIAAKLDIPKEKVIRNVTRLGNTSAASIPICLSEMWANNLLVEGDNVLMCSIGAGYSFGGLYMKWKEN